MGEGRDKTEAEQAGILVWGTIAARIADAIAPLAILYLIGESDVGAFATLMLIYRTTAVFLTAGFPRAVLYFLADRSRAARRQIVRRLTATNFALGAVGALLMVFVGVFGVDLLARAGAFLAEHFGREGTPGADSDPRALDSLRYLPLLAIFALFDMPSRLMPNILVAEKRPRSSAGVGVIYSLGMTCATLIPAALGWGVPGIVAGVALLGVCYGTLFLTVIHRLYADAGEPEADEEPTPPTFELIRYSFPLGITDIVSRLNASLDMWLIVMSFPLASVAHYQAGAWQIPVITTIAYSVGTVYLPRFATLYKAGKPREAIGVWRENIAKVSLIVVPATAVFIVGAEEFCRFVYPAEYGPAAGVFRAYCFLTVSRVAVFGSLILAAGKPKYVLYAACLTLLSNVVISVPLVLTVGFLGPAVGTALAFIPTVYVYCYFIARASGIPVTYTFPVWSYLRVVLAVLPACAAAVAIKLLVPWDYRVIFFVNAAVILAGYALVATLVGIVTREDWRFASNWVRLRVMK